MTKLGKSVSFLFIILLAGISFFVFSSLERDVPEPIVSAITNFEECADAGYPIMESYPEQCRTPDGRNFVRVIEEPIPAPDVVNRETAEFGKEISFKLNDSKTFTDGLTVNLKEINDSRCKPDVQCIWAGELSGVFSVSGGAFKTGEEVRLGTVNNNSVTVKGYVFTLQSATENSMTIVVSSNTLVGNDSYIKGHVSIGPFCPVQREGVPCPVPPEAYSSRQVIVYKSDGITIQQKVKIDSQGNYLVAELPGKYFLQISPAGIGPGEKKPVTVKQSSTTVVNFDIDTGIR